MHHICLAVQLSKVHTSVYIYFEMYVQMIWELFLHMQTLVTDFQEEQKKFEREKQRVKDTAVPPWVGYNEEEKMKAQILELSAVG